MTDPTMHKLLQCYQDELDNWNGVLQRHHQDSGVLIQKLNFLNELQSSHNKTGANLIDLLMLQQQKTTYLKGITNNHQLRFNHLKDLSIDSPWQLFGEEQDILRIKMRAHERDFMRIQYESEFFLFASLEEVVLASRCEAEAQSRRKEL